MEENFFEKLMIQSALTDKDYLITMVRVFESELFTNSAVGEIFIFLKSYVDEYGEKPDREIVLQSLPSDIRREAREIVEGQSDVDFDITTGYSWLLDETNKYLKTQSIKNAIWKSASILEEDSDISQIDGIISNAMTKDIKIDLGLDYFNSLDERVQKILQQSEIRIPTFFPKLDEMINGGIPPYTLSIIAARIHGMKSNIMANMARRQVLHGKNVVILTLEMSEDLFAQRFDASFAGMDINRIYNIRAMTAQMIRKIVEIKNDVNTGSLFIKQFPTGEASIADFRVYLRELAIRGIKPDIIYVDYINLMQPYIGMKSDIMYSKVKRIAEELRALSLEFDVPVFSVSQLNREGSNINFSETDFTYISESMGLPATADFMMILGSNEDTIVYESEVHGKIVKNRLGGRVGEFLKFYVDSRTLKMYDEVEEEIFLRECRESGGNLQRFVRTVERPGRRTRR